MVENEMVRAFVDLSGYTACMISLFRRHKDTDVESHDKGVCIPGYKIYGQLASFVEEA